MEEWSGWMNWPLAISWRCETCGEVSLTWGLVHATCRCDTCHTQYRMRDETGKVVAIPINQYKPEYLAAAIAAWHAWKRPASTYTDKDWDEALAMTAVT